MVQADSGMYRVQDHYFEACRQGLQKQDSKVSSSDWDSLDATLWPRLSQDEVNNPGAEMVSEDCFVEEYEDNESEWSLDIPEWKFQNFDVSN